ncbi:hypothetical protein GCM10010885_11020 [Alicyclobacillus cellulosilyticus]|uniref:Xylose isomerase-like TIM barrel domain-containing protein n=1 Tax=Alicyclobacillus cellulosilyticus TaxID=1003997 RepID=A0A917NK07_9BACL|nr:sugar phosphate isomerase/epimerase family protein [Alicyclobacillus cellulosilyticus]GGJ03519.1 hypothetical protein GCM10010885_11020 [Alicyclobacillus cellulosilyticus]
MKLAYSNLACPEWPLDEVMRRAAAYGYAGVELRLYEGEVIPARLPEGVVQAIRAAATAAGVTILGIGASTRFAMADPGERRRQEDELRAYLDLAARLGARFVRTFGGQMEGDAADCIARLAESLARVAEAADAAGVDILLETHDDFSPSARVRDALAAARHPRLGALWDVHHPYRMGETPAETMANLSPWLRHVHIKDARRRGDGWDLVPLGAGEVPVREILRALRAAGYSGWLSVEWERKWHPELQPAEEALPQHITVLRALWEETGGEATGGV